MNEDQRHQAMQMKPTTKENLERINLLNAKHMESKTSNQTIQPPNLKMARKRLKKDVDIHYDFTVPEELKRLGKDKKYLIRTYGCQMNEHDTEVMAGLLTDMGYQSTESVKEADLILLNTCAIRENAENRVFGELGHLKPLKKENPNLIVGICGCMSQEESVVNRILQKHPFVDLIFGTHNIHRLPHLVKESLLSKAMVVEVWSREGDIIENMPKKRQGKLKAWVNIMFGCDKFCTYCIVPYTRGKERSRLPEDVIDEVKSLVESGYKEITLLGQNVNAYGKDLTIDYGLGDLMAELSQFDIPRIRFTTSHPRDFDDHLIEVLSSGGNLVDHIHLPVQSGSSEILRVMARRHTREDYMRLVERIKRKIPNVTLTTDIIVGFPNETEEQFEETLSLVEAVGFDFAFTFIYSPREGTPAAKWADNISEEVKKERLQRLNRLINKQSKAAMERYVGQVVNVLVEGESRKDKKVLAGYTEQNKLVNFRASKSLIGEIVPVKITEAKTWSLNGEYVNS